MNTRWRVLLVALVLTSLLVVMPIVKFNLETKKDDDEPDFVFALITDSHCGADGYMERTNQSVLWIRDQNGIDFVIHTGDLVQIWNDPRSWHDIYQIMHQLDVAKNWAVLAGNHDRGPGNNLTCYTNTFGIDAVNQAITVENFTFIMMSWSSDDGKINSDQVEWLETQLSIHPNRKVVVAHHWLHSNPSEGHNYSASPSVAILRGYTNVVLALSGHNHENDYCCYNSHLHSVVSKSVGRGYVRLFHHYSNGSIRVRTRDVQNSVYLCGSDDDFWIT